MEKKINKLLARQLKRFYGSVENAPSELASFLNEINDTYSGFDDDIYLLQNSIQISSEESRDAFFKLKMSAEFQKETVANIKEAIYALAPNANTSLPDGINETSNNRELFNSLIRLIGDSKHSGEKALLESQLSYQTLIEISPEGIFKTDVEGKTTFVNRRWCQIAGLTYYEALGDGWLKAVHPDDQKKLFKNWKQATQINTFSASEYRFRHADGSVTWVQGYAIPEKNFANDIIGYVGTITDITQHKLAEEEIKKREEKYRIIAEKTTDVIWLMDLNGKSIYVSPSIQKFTGFTVEEYLCQSNGDRFTTKSAKMARSMVSVPSLKRLIDLRTQKENVNRLELEYRCKDGTTKVGELLMTPYFDNNKKLTGIHGVTRDITDRKRMEKKLDEREQLFRGLFNASPFGILLLDPHDKNISWPIVDCNSLVCEMNGYTRDELIGKSIDLLNLSEGTPEMRNEYLLTLRQNKLIHIETEHRHKKGHMVPIEVSSWIVTIGGKEMVLGIDRDISERKRAEMKLNASEVRYRKLFENLPIGIYQTSPKGTIIAKNPAFVHMLGDPSIEDLTKTSLEKYNQSAYKHSKFREQLECDGRITGLESEWHKTDNTTIFVRENVQVVRDEKGNVLYYEGTVEDITENKLAQIELIKAKDAAERANRLKSEFLRNISHEVRTPLNGIIGFSELLADENITREKLVEYTNVISKNSIQLLQIIDAIIEISCLETKQIDLHYSKTDINELLSDLYNNYKPRAIEKGLLLNIENSLVMNHVEIIIDRSKLLKVLNNLIENALKYTEEGFVGIGCRLSGGEILFHVKDSGIGIPKDKIEKIFERFSQANDSLSRFYGGLGLGLSIASENAKLLGGKINVESRQDKGSVFTLSVPYNSYTRTSPEITISENISSIHPSYTILIVENDDSNYHYVKDIIEKFNPEFTLIQASDGQDAVNICLTNPEIALVLMKTELPVLDGYKAMKQIKKVRSELPIIAQSAYSKMSDINRAKEVGCNEYMTIPLNNAILFKLLTKYLRKEKNTSFSVSHEAL